MRVFWYSTLILGLPTFAYSVYWLNFTTHRTSTVPWIFILFLGLLLCETTIYLVVVKSQGVKKLGIGGKQQQTGHH